MKQKRIKLTTLCLGFLIFGICFCLVANLVTLGFSKETEEKYQKGERKFALWTVETDIYDQMSSSSAVSGVGKKYGICYVLEEKDDWCYVESGSVRGFVKEETLIIGEGARTLADKLRDIREEQKADENGRYCYSLDVEHLNEDASEWLQESGRGKNTRDFLVSYALKFVGNPYEWGGTDLEEGADCSGFIQSVFAAYDYELSRTVEQQAREGERIAVDEAMPGDLIFYVSDGQIYHVALYLGNNRVVHALNEETGITVSDIYIGNADFAVRIIGAH